MGRYFFTWIGLFLFVIGTSIWLFPYMPVVPEGDVFQPHLIIPSAFSCTLIVAGIAFMLLMRNEDPKLRR